MNKPVGAGSTVSQLDREAVSAVWSTRCDRCRRPIRWNIEAEGHALGARRLVNLERLPEVERDLGAQALGLPDPEVLNCEVLRRESAKGSVDSF